MWACMRICVCVCACVRPHLASALVGSAPCDSMNMIGVTGDESLYMSARVEGGDSVNWGPRDAPTYL